MKRHVLQLSMTGVLLSLMMGLLAVAVHAQQANGAEGEEAMAPATAPVSEPVSDGRAVTRAASPRAAFNDQYSVIVERNMFLRERRRPVAPPPIRDLPDQPPPPPPPPETQFILVGIVIEDGQVRAYFEQAGYGTVRVAVAGDDIARGRITQVTLDAVAYEHNDRTTWVSIGQNLTGVAARATGLSPRPAAAVGAGPTTDDPAAPQLTEEDMAGLSIEERLRLRRQMQMGQ